MGADNPLFFCFWWLHTLRNTPFPIYLCGDEVTACDGKVNIFSNDRKTEGVVPYLHRYMHKHTHTTLLTTAHFKDIPVVKLNSIS